MKLAVIIGRFQPFHAGHLSLVTHALSIADEVLILIGSSHQLPDYKNPFSFEERLVLIHDMVGDTSRITLRPLPDTPDDEQWCSNVIGEVISKEEDPTEVMLLCHTKDEEYYRSSFLFPVETVGTMNVNATQIRHAWYTDALWTEREFISTNSVMFLENHHDKERLTNEYLVTEHSFRVKVDGHPFGNPIEPVSFAVILQGAKVLVGRRGGARGYGQLGLPGGYLESKESSLEGCMREVLEEVGLPLESLILQGKTRCIAQAVEENLNDLGTRTIGINYLFVINPDVEVELTLDHNETTEALWIPLIDVLHDTTLLFFNHNLVTKRLLSKLGASKNEE